jgi:DNA replication protein DnaC
MTEPENLTEHRPSALANLMAGIAERHPQIQAGPVEDEPTPDEPGHPEYHRARRAEWALGRWTTATPPRYRQATTTHPDIQQWADNVGTNPETAGSLLLTGTTGTGKTHQAYGALRRIAEAGPHRYEIIATTAADMYGLLRPKGSERGTEAELERLARIPLLLLDDLGSAKSSEWTEEITYRLINERYNACLPSIYTSNLPATSPDGRDITSALGERIASRLSQDTHVVAMAGPDLRRGLRSVS